MRRDGTFAMVLAKVSSVGGACLTGPSFRFVKAYRPVKGKEFSQGFHSGADEGEPSAGLAVVTGHGG